MPIRNEWDDGKFTVWISSELSFTLSSCNPVWSNAVCFFNSKNDGHVLQPSQPTWTMCRLQCDPCQANDYNQDETLQIIFFSLPCAIMMTDYPFKRLVVDISANPEWKPWMWLPDIFCKRPIDWHRMELLEFNCIFCILFPFSNWNGMTLQCKLLIKLKH